MGSGGISFLRAPDTPDAVTEEAGAPREHGFHPSWKRILLRPAHPAAIFCIAWDPKSRLVATTAADSTLALWDAKDWDSVHVFSEFIFPPRCIDFSCDGEWLAAGGEDAHVFLVRMNVAYNLRFLRYLSASPTKFLSPLQSILLHGTHPSRCWHIVALILRPQLKPQHARRPSGSIVFHRQARSAIVRTSHLTCLSHVMTYVRACVS